MIIDGATEAELSAHNLARRCAICGDAACVFRLGSDAEYVTQSRLSREGVRRVQVLVRAAIEGVDFCLTHGIERWPWVSHKHRQPQRTRR